MANDDVSLLVAQTYEALAAAGGHALPWVGQQALLSRQGVDEPVDVAEARDNRCALDDLGSLLDEIPDSTLKKHNNECWKLHAACLRDKINTTMGWETT